MGSVFSALFVLMIGFLADIYGVGLGIGFVSITVILTIPFIRIK